MKILVADDDALWVKIACHYFSLKKHEVRSAGTFAGALALAAEQRPDCILADGELADGGVGAFCAAIRAAGLEKTALVCVSGAEQCPAESGADACVVKGGALSELEAVMDAALKARLG
jgi:DNA-binding response OmpR family regulator